MRTSPLTDHDHALIEHARRIVDAHTDGPNGIHTVGAAVRDIDGAIHGGINLYHFNGGPCAELVALATARANGARQLDVIVAVGNAGRGPLAPCGRDRQVMYDLHPTIEVIVPIDGGAARVPVDELLPAAPAR